MTALLPIIPDCHGCGACCLTMGSPPMYAYIANNLDTLVDNPHITSPDMLDDIRRVLELPLELRAELQRLPGFPFDESPCIWLEKGTRRCSRYDVRPSICRGFEPGCRECHEWRQLFGLATPENDQEPKS